MNKVNRILLGVLAFQVALVLFVFLRGDDTGIGSLEPLLPGFTGDKVERVRIFDRTAKSNTPAPGEEEEDGGEKKGKPGEQPAVDLVKKGENWTLASHFSYPVDAQRVTELVGKVEGMRSRAPIASGKARQKQLEVADDSYQRKVVVTAGGKDTTFYLGASSGQRQTSVRIGGSDEVHGVTGLTAQGVGARASAWVDTAYVDVQADRVASFDVVNGNGSFHFERAESGGPWQVTAGGQPVTPPSGMELNKGEIEKMVSRATKIHLAQPADPKRAIEKPLATVTLRLKPEPKEEQAEGEEAKGEEAKGDEAVSTLDSAGEERVVEIASSDKKDRYYVREKGRDRAALVDALSVTELVEVSRDRLIQKKGAKPEPDQGGMPMEGMPPGMMPPGAMPPGAMPPGADPHGMPPGVDPGEMEPQQ